MGALQGRICAITGWELTEAASTDGDWTVEGIAAQPGAAAV